MHPILRIRKWRNQWKRKTTAARTAVKLTVLAETIMLFFLAWGFIPYWSELVKTETPAYAQEPIKIEPMPSEILDTINYYAQRFGVDPKLALAIVDCESKGNPTIIGDYQAKMVSVGLWQFQFLTFYEAAKKYGVKNADIRDHRDQTLIAMQILRDNGKNIWTCGKNIK